MHKKIKPFINNFKDHNFKSREFKIHVVSLDKIRGGWLRLYLKWAAQREEYKFKYASEASSSISVYGNYFARSVELEFPQIKRGRNSIDVGLEFPKHLFYKYNLEYVQSIKYGARIFFSPKNWNNGEGEIPIYNWEEDFQIAKVK